jgi:tetratricopeptide (TPR) repeat protein
MFKNPPLRIIFFGALALLLMLMLRTVAYAENSKPLESPSPAVNGTVLKGIHLLYDWQFDHAEALFRKVIADSPDEPIGYFYLAMVTWSYLSTGYWTPEKVKEYDERLDRTIEVARRRIGENRAGPYDFLYLGGALGFKGRFELMRRKWLSSFLLASEAVDALKTCQEMDPNNKDVLLGLGIFDYYTARLSGVLKFLSYLLIHRGDREEGLRKLEVAAKEATYSASEAKSVLLHIYLFLEGDPAKALVLADDLAGRYKESPRYPVLQGVCYIRLGRDGKYRETVNDLVERSLKGSSTEGMAMWAKRSLYLESIFDLYHGRYQEGRVKLETILGRRDPLKDPEMIAWPLLKVGMSFDLQGKREEARKYYRNILEMENPSGAQFLAENYLNNPPGKQDPFIGF